jgi:hypothetical protein
MNHPSREKSFFGKPRHQRLTGGASSRPIATWLSYTRFPWKAEYTFSQKTRGRGTRTPFLRILFSGSKGTQVYFRARKEKVSNRLRLCVFLKAETNQKARFVFAQIRMSFPRRRESSGRASARLKSQHNHEASANLQHF